MRITQLLYIIIFSFIACKREYSVENIPLPPITDKKEAPLQNLLTIKYFDSIVPFNTDTWELGYRFSPTVDGHIVMLGCFMPNNLTYRVSLWDYKSQNLLDTALITTKDSTKFNYVTINPILIKAKKQYIISINNVIQGFPRSYYLLYRKSPKTITFPIISRNIKIESYQDIKCSTLCFPSREEAITNIGLYGIPDFVFEPEN